MKNQPRISFTFLKLCLTLTIAIAATCVGANPALAQAKETAVKTDAKPAGKTEAPNREKTDAPPKAIPKSKEKKKMLADKAPDSEESATNESKAKETKSTEKESSDGKAKAPEPLTEDETLLAEWTSKGVWLSPPTDGEAATDFMLVGEYAGKLKSDDGKANTLGVQIRTLGGGQFEARAYQGGLPGQKGFTEKEMMVLIGRRSGKTLVLSGGPWAMFAGEKQCKIIDAEGSLLGDLPRANRVSPTLGAKPPKGAMVLFDGTGTDALVNGRMTPHGLLRQGADINFMLSDFDLHLEFRIPHMPKFLEQARGNSGLYLQSRYECQVLDSFGAARVFNGLGALYRYRAADVNMAFPPLVWQTYDIHFTAARFGADGKKLRNAHVTSWVNGVKVQDNQELPGPTGHGQPESTTLLPTKMQDHKDPVRYRNVWVIDRGLTGGIEFPQIVK